MLFEVLIQFPIQVFFGGFRVKLTPTALKVKVSHYPAQQNVPAQECSTSLTGTAVDEVHSDRNTSNGK